MRFLLVTPDDALETRLRGALPAGCGVDVEMVRAATFEAGRMALQVESFDCAVVTQKQAASADGLSFCALARKDDPEVTLFLLVQGADSAVIFRALELGADDAIPIEVPDVALCHAIRKALLRRKREAEHAALVERLEGLATLDPLTGLLNRRGTETSLKREQNLALRRNVESHFILVDVDEFKAFNDNHGYDVGDEVLCSVANLIRGSVRGTDHVGRIGGDEFLVLLPGCKLGAALALAERIRSRLATAVVRTGGEELAVRASLGVAGLPMAVTTVTDAVKLVSTAIHRSKQRGKNRVTVEMDTISGEIEAVELSEEDGDFEAGETMVLVQPIARLADEMPIARWIQPVGPLLAVSTMSSGPVSIASRALIERDLELLRSAVGAVAAAGDAGPFYFSILPETLRTTPPSELLEIVDAIDGRPAVGFMLADHHLVGDPSGVADAVVVLREMGMGLAMRGAGFGPQSLEAMALLRPGVVAVPVKQLLGHEPESGRLDLLLRRIRVVRSLGAEVAMEGMVDESDRALAGELGLTLGLGSGVGAVTIRRGVGTG